MTSIRRLLLRCAIAAGAVGATMAIALAPQPGLATTRSVEQSPPPSAACVAARNSFVAALKADLAEDSIERNLEKTGASTNDPAEDQAERANFKSLFVAMAKACAPSEATEEQYRPAPTAACTSAATALKTFLVQQHATEKAEWSNGTEGTSADTAADQASWAQLKALFRNVATACGRH